MFNLDTEYEKLTREVYEEILKSDGFDTILVKHNVNIAGKSTQQHQLDVYWEFKVAGITHRVAVECKNYTSTITIGKVRDFAATLDDIGNTQGIFITKIGYQKGAKVFADYKGIELKVLREPTDKDLEIASGIKTIHISGTMYYLDNVRPELKLDFNWIESNTTLRKGESYEISGRSDKIIIIDESDNTVAKWSKLQNELAKTSGKFEEFEDRIKLYDFTTHYITWPNCKYGKLKLEKIGFQYNIRTTKTFSKSEGKIAAKAVLEDIKTGEIHLHKREVTVESNTECEEFSKKL
ncbi:restriction endonuclease [Pseudomonas fluorescens]